MFGNLQPHFHESGLASGNGNCSTDIVVVVPRELEWGTLALACQSPDRFADRTDRTSAGIRNPRTGSKTMRRGGIRLPPIRAVCAFQDLVRPLVDPVRVNIHEACALGQTRNLLPAKLISGDTRVRDAERVAEAIA